MSNKSKRIAKSIAKSAPAAETPAAETPAATIGDNSAKVLPAMPVAFVLGVKREGIDAEVMAHIRQLQGAALELALKHIKAGMLAVRLWPSAAVTPDLLTAAMSVLDKKGKARTDAEAKAEKSARNATSRFAQHLKLERDGKGSGGHNAMTDAEREAKRKAEAAEREAKQNAADQERVNEKLAQHLTPNLATLADVRKHVAVVEKQLQMTFTKSQPLFKADAYALIRKALTDFHKAVAAVMDAETK